MYKLASRNSISIRSQISCESKV